MAPIKRAVALITYFQFRKHQTPLLHL